MPTRDERAWAAEAKSDRKPQSNLYELKGKLSAFLILEQTTQKDPHARNPHPHLQLQGIAVSKRKCHQKKKELELQKVTNLE